MSMEMHVLFHGKLPSKAALNAAMKQLGFPLAVKPATGSLESQSGFMPMHFRLEQTGVEFDVFNGRAAVVLDTGGPRPYGYAGLGELFVFLFFGIVAVAGSYFVQTEDLRWEAFALAVPVGLLAAAILVVNNVRDIDTDRRAGKRTLAVRLGRDRTRGVFAAMIYLAYPLALVTWVFGPLRGWLLLPWLTLPLAVPLVRVVRNRADGPALNGALAQTGILQLAFCMLLSAGLLLSR